MAGCRTQRDPCLEKGASCQQQTLRVRNCPRSPVTLQFDPQTPDEFYQMYPMRIQRTQGQLVLHRVQQFIDRHTEESQRTSSAEEGTFVVGLFFGSVEKNYLFIYLFIYLSTASGTPKSSTHVAFLLDYLLLHIINLPPKYKICTVIVCF